MNSKVIVSCDVHIDMGSAGGYTANDDLERIKKYFGEKATRELNAVLSATTNMSFSKPKFTIILKD